jgi:hypothetical protein
MPALYYCNKEVHPVPGADNRVKLTHPDTEMRPALANMEHLDSSCLSSSVTVA